MITVLQEGLTSAEDGEGDLLSTFLLVIEEPATTNTP